MIVALEGPDCCGKTTAFQLLTSRMPMGTIMVPKRQWTKATMGAISELNLSVEHLWRHLYVPRTLYVCDRFHAVSDPVYAPYHGRPVVDYSYWYEHVFVVYLDVPISELRRRHAIRGDEHFDADSYEQIVAAYKLRLRNFKHVVMQDPTADRVLKCIVEAWARNNP